MLAASLAPWFTRHGIHYGWVMVALTFVTAICSTAAIGMLGVLILPISREFGWSRGDISGAMALTLVMFGGMAPFAGALMLRYGLRRVVVAAALMVVVALIDATQMTAKWHLWLTLGLLLGIAAGATAFVLAATVASDIQPTPLAELTTHIDTLIKTDRQLKRLQTKSLPIDSLRA